MRWGCYNSEAGCHPEAYGTIILHSNAMNYFKGILSGMAAIFLAECVPGSWSVFKGISQEKATGLGAVAAGVVESIFSPLFWILAVLFFAFFFAASRFGNRLLRIFLFWIPTVLFSTLLMAVLALFADVFLRFRQH